MKVDFYKYQGTGNDFIMIDNRELRFPAADTELIARLCHRRFGIGADGLILLQNHPQHGIEMVYFNSDGRPSSMCGNGGRCFAAFAKQLGLAEEKMHFLAVDGPHDATIDGEGIVSLKMQDVKDISPRATAYVLNTGSPHFVLFQEGIDDINFVKLAKAIRHNAEFDREGINVNFVEDKGPDAIKMRTFERGVEDETYSCGTGVVAASLVHYYAHSDKGEADRTVAVKTVGGNLKVKFHYAPETGFSDVWLIGPAERVFEGDLEL
jgi:diaminopimelate epimerase